MKFLRYSLSLCVLCACSLSSFAEPPLLVKSAQTEHTATMSQVKTLAAQGTAFVNAGVSYRVVPNTSVATDSNSSSQKVGSFQLLFNTPNLKSTSPIVVFNESRNAVALLTGDIWVTSGSVASAEGILKRANLQYEYVPSINQFVVHANPSAAIALKQQLSGYPELSSVMLEIQENLNVPH
jgi:hypothetical protein